MSHPRGDCRLLTIAKVSVVGKRAMFKASHAPKQCIHINKVTKKRRNLKNRTINNFDVNTFHSRESHHAANHTASTIWICRDDIIASKPLLVLSVWRIYHRTKAWNSKPTINTRMSGRKGRKHLVNWTRRIIFPHSLTLDSLLHAPQPEKKYEQKVVSSM